MSHTRNSAEKFQAIILQLEQAFQEKLHNRYERTILLILKF